MLKRFMFLAALVAVAAFAPASALAFDQPFLGQFSTVTQVGSTVPSNGDVNPYGIATVPSSVGSLVHDDILISNFNNSENLQGTGTTIVQESATGHLSLFAHVAPGSVPFGVGLTTALAILPGGFVVVGSLPTSTGKAATASAGGLIVLDSNGHVVRTISGAPINGPWDLTAVSAGPFTDLFVTNVLNGTVENGEKVTNGGTVVRVGLLTLPGHAPFVTSERVIANGFPERTSEAALVVGPTGDALGPEGTLYVADTQGNRIAAVPAALFRQTPLGAGGITIAKGGFLNGPLGLAIAPNGDVLTANANDGNLIETTPAGAEFQPFETPAGEGGLFGLTVAPNGQGVYFVNDASNMLELLH
jgi:sugar lactone lactonase YvrE